MTTIFSENFKSLLYYSTVDPKVVFTLKVKCQKGELVYLEYYGHTSAKHGVDGTAEDQEKFGTKTFYQLYNKNPDFQKYNYDPARDHL